jgi:hypothetical protein
MTWQGSSVSVARVIFVLSRQRERPRREPDAPGVSRRAIRRDRATAYLTG